MSNKFKRLYRVSHLDELKDWCKSQAGMVRSTSTYVVGNRSEKWFEKGWTLAKSPTVFDADRDPRIHALGQRLYPGNHSCLFLHYQPNSYIKPHRDHPVSENWVVQVNVGSPVYFQLEGQRYLVGDGEVIGFDSKLLHGTTICSQERWVVSWRKIKPEYLVRQLDLDQYLQA